MHHYKHRYVSRLKCICFCSIRIIFSVLLWNLLFCTLNHVSLILSSSSGWPHRIVLCLAHPLFDLAHPEEQVMCFSPHTRRPWPWKGPQPRYACDLYNPSFIFSGIKFLNAGKVNIYFVLYLPIESTVLHPVTWLDGGNDEKSSKSVLDRENT